jgi:NitT/TauT family transport system permease protein
MATATSMRSVLEAEAFGGAPEEGKPGAVAPALAPVPEPALRPEAARVAPPDVARGRPAGTLLRSLAGVVNRRVPAALLTLSSIALLLGFWYLATEYRWQFYIRFTNVPSPGEVFHEAGKLVDDPKFFSHIALSLRRIFFGFATATVLGVSLGLVIGRYALARGLLFPALEVLRPIPAIAWVPISIMLWPTAETSIVFITFIGAFFPILLNTMDGVAAVDDVLLRAARSLGASEFALMNQVVLRGALPQVFTGLAVGMGVAWVSLIAAEMISGQFGIGYFTWEAYSLIEYSHIVIGMIVIGVLGLACSGAIRLLARLVMPWQITGSGGGRP